MSNNFELAKRLFDLAIEHHPDSGSLLWKIEKELNKAFPPEALEKRRSDFIEAILNLALKRQQGYAERRHGDVLNKECMDEVVQLCKGMAQAAVESLRSPLARSQEKS